jgi:hypothetical protein
MGYKTGEIALRIKNGEDPGHIPIQSMSRVRLYLNLPAAGKQGVRFSPQILERADDVIRSEDSMEQAETRHGRVLVPYKSRNIARPFPRRTAFFKAAWVNSMAREQASTTDFFMTR